MSDGVVGRPMLASTHAVTYQPFEIHPAAFTPKQCARIISAGLTLETEVGALEATDGGGVTDDGIRRSHTAWIPPTDETWWIYDKLAKVAERANRRYRFDLTGFSEDLQFTHYDEPGSFYDWHQDGLDGDVANRKLSVVVQLSDPAVYDGGELQFFDVVHDYDDEQEDNFSHHVSQLGTAVVFPSFEYHRVLALRRGVRYSLVCWVSGPAFR